MEPNIAGDIHTWMHVYEKAYVLALVSCSFLVLCYASTSHHYLPNCSGENSSLSFFLMVFSVGFAPL